jgi:hypothetical protein
LVTDGERHVQVEISLKLLAKQSNSIFGIRRDKLPFRQWRDVALGRLAEQPEGGLPPFIYRLSSRLPAPGVLTR